MSCSAHPVSVCLRAGAYLCADRCIAKAQTQICDAVIKEEGYGYRGTHQAAIPALFGLVSRCVRFCREQREQTPARAVGRIWAGFRRLTRDEKESRIKNRRQVWRSVRSLLPAVRAVTGVFGEFQSGVKIRGVIWLLRSSSPRAYSNKKKVGVMPWKRCYCEQKASSALPDARAEDAFFAGEHPQELRRKTKNKPRRSSNRN